MSTDEYVPSEQDLEVAWIESEASADDINAASAEFRRGLARVRCEAYDEGYQDAQDDEREHRPWRKSTHPYRQEQNNE